MKEDAYFEDFFDNTDEILDDFLTEDDEDLWKGFFESVTFSKIKLIWSELSSSNRKMAKKEILEALKKRMKNPEIEYSNGEILLNALQGKILYPCYDPVFKALFLDEDEKEKGYPALKNLIECTIFKNRRKCHILKLLYSEQSISLYGDKIFKVDIVVELDDKEKCNIEMQLANTLGLSSRMGMHVAKLHASQMKKGDSYVNICKTYTLWILVFDFTKRKGNYHTISLRYNETPHEEFNLDMQVHIFEVGKKVGNEKKEDKLSFSKEKNVDVFQGILKSEESLNHPWLDFWNQFFSMKSEADCSRIEKEGGELMANMTRKLRGLSNNDHFRGELFSESLKDMGHRIEKGFYYAKGKSDGEVIGETRGEIRGEIRGKVAMCVSMKYSISEGIVEEEIYPIKSVEDLSSLFLFVKESSSTLEEVLDLISQLRRKSS